MERDRQAREQRNHELQLKMLEALGGRGNQAGPSLTELIAGVEALRRPSIFSDQTGKMRAPNSGKLRSRRRSVHSRLDSLQRTREPLANIPMTEPTLCSLLQNAGNQIRHDPLPLYSHPFKVVT